MMAFWIGYAVVFVLLAMIATVVESSWHMRAVSYLACVFWIVVLAAFAAAVVADELDTRPRRQKRNGMFS